MVKVFKQIRHKLFVDNKSGKYLMYSIGEIALVVIGILIALAINNWNTDKKQRVLEESILDQFKVGLQTDLEDINKNIWAHEQASKSCGIILNQLENRLSYNDSLSRHFAHAYLMTNLNISTSTFETLKSIGLNIIENVELRNSIINLYDNLYPLIKMEEADLRSRYNYQFNEVLNTRMVSNYNLNYKTKDNIGSMVPIHFDQLFGDQEYIYSLNSNKNYIDNIYLKYRYYPLREKVTKLIESIENAKKTKE